MAETEEGSANLLALSPTNFLIKVEENKTVLKLGRSNLNDKETVLNMIFSRSCENACAACNGLALQGARLLDDGKDGKQIFDAA